MKTKTNNLLIATIMLATLSFTSCKKEDETILKNENPVLKTEQFNKLATKQATVNAGYMNIANLVSQFSYQFSKSMKMQGGPEGSTFACAVVTIDSSSSPRIATIDFRPGCTDVDGKIYNGVITMEYLSSEMDISGNIVTVTATNFTIDSLSFDGTMEYENLGLDSANNMVGEARYNMTTTFAHDNLILNGIVDITFEWVSARNTAFLELSGTGTDNNGITFSQSTAAKIFQKQETGCSDHFVKGKLLLQSPGLSDQLIDYGDGTCDDQAISTVDGIDTQFTLQ